MFRVFIVFLTAMFLALPAQASDRDFGQDVLNQSRYYGVGWQKDGQHWSIEVLINAGGGQIAYPSLECSGTWTANQAQAEKLEYMEQITEGAEDCLSIGIVQLQPLEGGRLLYTWFETPEVIEARAVLLPVSGDRPSYMEQLMLTLNTVGFDFMFPEYTE